MCESEINRIFIFFYICLCDLDTELTDHCSEIFVCAILWKEEEEKEEETGYTSKWYMDKPDYVLNNLTLKSLCDF